MDTLQDRSLLIVSSVSHCFHSLQNIVLFLQIPSIFWRFDAMLPIARECFPENAKTYSWISRKFYRIFARLSKCHGVGMFVRFVFNPFPSVVRYFFPKTSTSPQGSDRTPRHALRGWRLLGEAQAAEGVPRVGEPASCRRTGRLSVLLVY